MIEAYPLSWPSGWKRTGNRVRARFGRQEGVYRDGQLAYNSKKQLSVADATARIQAELQRFNIREADIIISTNLSLRNDGLPRSGQSAPKDPGAAVYWKRKGKQQCMAIDLYDRVADNLAAIAASIAALRAIERHGGAQILDRAFQGFAQLPAALITQRPWREVFGVGDDERLNEDAIVTRFNALAHKVHPDRGGSHEQMVELNAAKVEALAEIRG